MSAYLTAVRRRILVNGVLASSFVPNKVRWRLLRATGIRTQECTISEAVWFGGSVSIGRGTYVNRQAFFDASAPISIGRDVSVGMGVAFVTSTHALGSPAKRAGTPTALPITVGDGVWIGAFARILPGVHLGDGSVVAAGSIVTQDTLPNALYAGVPAALKREFSEPGT